MYCRKCGAVITGKYCANCGYKVQNDLAEFRRAERKAIKEYEKQFDAFTNHERSTYDLSLVHLISACWHACSMKYGRNMVVRSGPSGEWLPSPHAYETLEIVKEHATRLCERFLAERDY